MNWPYKSNFVGRLKFGFRSGFSIQPIMLINSAFSNSLESLYISSLRQRIVWNINKWPARQIVWYRHAILQDVWGTYLYVALYYGKFIYENVDSLRIQFSWFWTVKDWEICWNFVTKACLSWWTIVKLNYISTNQYKSIITATKMFKLIKFIKISGIFFLV